MGMDKDADSLLDTYAELALVEGVNLQPGQRLQIGTATEIFRTPLESAPLVRKIAQKAYRMGASLVEVYWGDDQLKPIRLTHAAKETLEEYPSWIAGEIENEIHRGDASLCIWGEDPYLLDGIDPERITIVQQTKYKILEKLYELDAQNPRNWSGIMYPVPAWAEAVFPDLSRQEAVAKVWDYIVQFCRLEKPDPLAYWKSHNDDLDNRAQWLTQANFKRLHLKSPETDLKMDIPKGHIWFGGRSKLPSGLEFCPNLPTEEVCTLPHRTGVNGHVLATKPFSYMGMNVEGMRLEFEDGLVVQATAEKGEEQLKTILDLDEGSRRLGEVALVPHSTPISQSQILFHHGLLDENASVHLAFGSAYRFNLTDGEKMDNETFMAAGGNFSKIHLDFMIGSADMDVDGIKENGDVEPLLKAGEWAFKP
ncbi:MAG: aminopeptidase [Anaerolineales bacterium]|jgi:aminopeptidase